jgi:hypothetical protein
MGNGSLTSEWLKGGVAAVEVSGNGARLPEQSFTTGMPGLKR